MNLSEVDHYNKFGSMVKIFITDQNSVFLNRLDACGFCYEFVMKTELNIFDGCCLKDILNMKISMGIKELYIEMNKGVINNFIRLENEKNIINESELCITPFSKRLVAKLSTREREVKIVELLSYLKMNDSIKALQLIQYIKMQNVLSNGDVCNLYSLYLKYLKSISPRFIDNNIFYLKRLVLGLISLNKINLIL